MSMRAFLGAGALALALLPAAGALTASAEDGRPRPVQPVGRPPRSVLEPTDIGRAQPVEIWSSRGVPKELVLFVGGLGSAADDASFDALVGRFSKDPRYEIRRFGALPEHPYDTLGDPDRNAAELTAEVRELAPHYRGVHVVTHSMGGSVVDRAFQTGLGANDGVRTYVAIAPPHERVFLARLAQRTMREVGGDAPAVRAVFRGLGGDPGSDAVPGLARLRAASPPPGVTRFDLRLATDEIVFRADARTPGVESRTLLPITPGEALEGHGRSIVDRRILDAVHTTIESGAVPPDARPLWVRLATDAVSYLYDRQVERGWLLVRWIVLITLMGLALARLASRILRWLRRQLEVRRLIAAAP